MQPLPTPPPDFFDQGQLAYDAMRLAVDLADFWLWLIGILLALMLLALLAGTLIQVARGARDDL